MRRNQLLQNAGSRTQATPQPPVEEGVYNLIIVFWGESNSGGDAVNADALPAEVGLRDDIYIWDNVNTGVDQLNIGVNNLLGHAGIDPPHDTTKHGWELEIANQVGNFNTDNVYLVKTGQGGSRVSYWNVGGNYMENIYKPRVQGMIDHLAGVNSKPNKIYHLVSMGINDGIAHTDATTFYNQLDAIFDEIRATFGNTHFYCTNIPIFAHLPAETQYFIDIDDKITLMGTNNADVTAISTTAAALGPDQTHWNYSGMKTIAADMLTYIIPDFNAL